MADVAFGILLIIGAFAGPLSAHISAVPVYTEPVSLVVQLPGLMSSNESTGFAVAPDGSLAIVDRGRRVIRRLDSNGQFLTEWGPAFGPGVDAADLAGIAPDGDGWAVLDRGASRILRLDARGQAKVSRIIDLGPLGTYGPNGLASDSKGDLYLADTGSDRIVVFTPDGQMRGAVGSAGTDLGRLRQPMFLAFAPDGGFFVTDWGNTRVQHFDADQRATTAWPMTALAWAIAVDAAGRVFVPDAAHQAISIFATDGAPLGEIAADPSDGFSVQATSQVAISPDGGRLWVLSSGGLFAFDLTPYADLGPLPPLPRSQPVQIPLALLGTTLLVVAAGSLVRSRLAGSTEALDVPRLLTSVQWTATFDQSTFRSRWPANRRQYLIEIACVCAIVLAALVLRAHDLGTLPHGLHGDEADTGLEAQRILKQGWIGLYSPLAIGRPTGPLYLTAVSVAFMGNTILAVRVIPMIMGVLTVAALYFVVRRNGPAPVALLSAGALAIMDWHIHLSRIAFHSASWGLIVVLAAGALLEASRGKHWWWWLVGGALAGAGVYFYQAAWLALACFGGFVALLLLTSWLLDKPRPRAAIAISATAFGAGVLVAVLPMALWAADPANGYFSSFDMVSSLTKPAYQQLPTAWDRAAYLAARYGAFWVRVCCSPSLDTVDGSGIPPIVPPLQLGLALIGILVSLRWWRSPLVQLTLVFLLIAPIGSVVTLDGPARRVFELVPFLAIATALGVFALFVGASRYTVSIRVGAAALAMVVIGVIAFQNLYDYFGVFADSGGDQWVFAQELTDATLYMAALPAGTQVYFYSDRWGVTYETTRFLAPDLLAEDRSQEFSPAHVVDTTLTAEPAVFVLIGRYRPLLTQLESEYPGGQITYGRTADNPTFIAYAPPDR